MPFELCILNFACIVLLNHVCDDTITEGHLKFLIMILEFTGSVSFLTKLCLTKDIRILVFSFRISSTQILRTNQTEKFHCLQSILRSKCFGRYMTDVLPCLKLSVYYRKKHLNKHKFGSAKYYLHMDNFSFFIMRCLTMRKKCKMLA